jgi:mRNA interferase RelE/StbE
VVNRVYGAVFSPAARAFLIRADKPLRRQLGASIREIQIDPRRDGVKKLKGKLFKKTAYRYRSGDYRILYHIDDQYVVIDVVKVGHRRDVYE